MGPPFADADFADKVLAYYGDVPFRSTIRKTHTVLYLKDSEKIADFLVYVNAMKGKLKLENVIIGRSMRNTANGQSTGLYRKKTACGNCDVKKQRRVRRIAKSIERNSRIKTGISRGYFGRDSR